MHEMGPGTHRETLNDHWNGWNFRKIIDFCKFNFLFGGFNVLGLILTLFLKCFKDAVAMHKRHAKAFEQFLSTFDEDTYMRWAMMVDSRL